MNITTWQVSPVDSPEQLKVSMEANIFAFQELADKNDFETVKAFRKDNEAIFTRLDQEYSSRCHDDSALVAWANRMRTVRRHLDELDRHIAFAGKRQFNWEAVVVAVGILNAYRVASEQTLELNSA